MSSRGSIRRHRNVAGYSHAQLRVGEPPLPSTPRLRIGAYERLPTLSPLSALQVPGRRPQPARRRRPRFQLAPSCTSRAWRRREAAGLLQGISGTRSSDEALHRAVGLTVRRAPSTAAVGSTPLRRRI